MFLPAVAILARADDVAVWLRCLAALEREVLRPCAQVTGGEVADASVSGVTDAHERMNCGCTAWGERTTMACAPLHLGNAGGRCWLTRAGAGRGSRPESVVSAGSFPVFRGGS